MVKKCIFFIIFLTISTVIFCNSFERKSIFHMDITPEFGIINGTIGEFVFNDSCLNTDNMLSRLDWDILSIPYAELNVSIDLFKYFYLGFSGRFVLPLYSGYMQDYDWLNSCPPSELGYKVQQEWLQDNPTELTNYSKHNNKIDKYYTLSAKIGGNIPVCDYFTITPYIGYCYDFIEMSAYGGYTKYKWDDFKKKEIVVDNIISYSQEINEFILGVQLYFSGIPRTPMFLDFSIVPGLGKLAALDIHYGRELAYLDILSPLFLLNTKFSCFYEINKHNKVGGSAFINFMPLDKGITGIGPVKNGNLPKVFHGNPTSMGGASRFLFGFSVSYEFTF